MLRFLLLFSLCSSGIAEKPLLAPRLHAPWVTCFAESGAWVGEKQVRTPIVASSNRKLLAYARIEARGGSPNECGNTVHLLVSTNEPTRFREVFTLGPSMLDGNQNSLAPLSWSPDKRWLLAEFETGSYASDAGGRTALLYDRKSNKAFVPDLADLVKARLGQQCWIWVSQVGAFDALSRVRLRLTDQTAEGDDEPTTHCFHGTELWLLDPVTLTIRRSSSRR